MIPPLEKKAIEPAGYRILLKFDDFLNLDNFFRKELKSFHNYQVLKTCLAPSPFHKKN